MSAARLIRVNNVVFIKKKKGSKLSRLNDNEPQVGLVRSTHPGATDEEWGRRRLGQRPGTLLSYSI